MNEAQLVKKLKEHIEKDGFVVKFHGSILTASGVPDLIGSYKGIPIAIECKVEHNTPSKLQLYFLKKFAQGGYFTGVIYSVEQFEEEFSLKDMCYELD